MNKTESRIVGAMLGVLCPWLTGVLFWWTTAAIAIGGFARISERAITAAALTGLAVGAGLDALWLKRWVECFYRANLKLMSALYLAYSVIALASCMGLPLGNLVLGAVAGAYVGRRSFHAGSSEENHERLAQHAGIFTAIVTGTEAFGIGLLALNDQWVTQKLADWSHLKPAVVAGAGGTLLVVALVLILMVIQFWCTRTAARRAFCQGKKPGG
jgi:predicted membrane protein